MNQQTKGGFLLGFLLYFLCPSAYASPIDSLLMELKHLKQDTIRVNTLLKLSELTLGVDPEESRKYAMEAKELSYKLSFRRGEAGALRLAGATYLMTGDYPNATAILSDALQLSEAIAYPNAIGACAYNLGIAYYYQEDYVDALRYNLYALKSYEKAENKVGIAKALNGIGAIYEKEKKWDKAIECFEKAIPIFTQLNNQAELASLYTNLGMVYQYQGNKAKAKPYVDKALQIIRETKNLFALRVALSNKASILLESDSLDLALSYFQESLTYCKQFGDTALSVINFTGISDAYLRKKDRDKAIEFGKKAVELGGKLKMHRELAVAYGHISRAYEEKEEYKQALDYQRFFQIEQDSAFQEAKSGQISLLQTEFEVEKKDHENEMLRKGRKLNTKIIQQQRLGLILGGVLICLALGLSFFLLSGRKKLKLSNELLAIQKQDLEESNQVRNKLFSIISHDLRGPIFSLKTLLQLWKDEQISQEKLTGLIPKVFREVSHTSDLLEKILIWSRSQLGGIVLSLKNVNLTEIIAEDLAFFEESATEKNILFENTLKSSIFVYADDEMLSAVFRNLIGNAIKFTDSGGTISIITDNRNPSECVIGVKDTGIGMSEKVKAMLFSGFVSTRGTKDEKGTGLGLVLVKDFVEKNGGKIRVESEEGNGSTFWVSFPILSK